MWPARSRAWPLCSHRARSIMPSADLGAAAWPRFSWCALSADPAAHIRVSEGDARSLCQAIPEVRRIAAAFVVGLGWVCSAGNAGRSGVTLAGVAVQVQDRVRARHASTAGYSARALGPQVCLQIGGGGWVQSAAPRKTGRVDAISRCANHDTRSTSSGPSGTRPQAPAASGAPCCSVQL